MRPHLENKPGLHEGIRFLGRMLAKKHIFELLRYELLETWPESGFSRAVSYT